jgi:tight adherence protein B
MAILPMILLGSGALLAVILLAAAFSGPSLSSAQSRRIGSIKERHSGSGFSTESQMRKLIAARPAVSVKGAQNLLPNRAALQKRLSMTGKSISVNQYLMASAGILALIAIVLMAKGLPWYLGGLVGLAIGLLVPHIVIGKMIKKRIANFTARFPDAIELMVRGLRSGLPISETLSVVASELPGPIGVEFRLVTDKIKIGRTMDEALLDVAERLNTPEFQFFCITLTIQRETGGNLAETLSNLAEVLRKRAQMKLKIRAMSSESKASAYIVGSLPFFVFTIIYMQNPKYIGGFFIDPRLMIAGAGGFTWMAIGAFIMAKMISFEI